MTRGLRNRLKERWEKLTDGDLDLVDGQAARLLVLLQEKYGRARPAAERELLQFLDDSLLWVERGQRRAVGERSGTRGAATAAPARQAQAQDVLVPKVPRPALTLRRESLRLTPP